MHIRIATENDAEAIANIYNREVTGSLVTFDMIPRTIAVQREWIRAHSGVHPAVVAMDDGDDVIGFGSLSAYRSRPAYSTTVEDSVYVRHDRVGEGVGRSLVKELIRLASDHGFHTIIGRIVNGHEASIALHRSCGFELIGVEREVGRKFGRWLDVAIMQRML